MNPETRSAADDGVTQISCDFVRNRNVLLTHGDMRPLFERWHRHHDDHRLDLDPSHARMFEDALAAFVLHLAGQPRNRHMSWTINIGKPPVNLFLGGSTYDGTATGRLFTENVAEFATGQFYQEAYAAGKGPFRSHATFTGDDVLDAVAQYYASSEQRPARIFHLGGCKFAMAHAHPDYDEGWFTSLTTEQVADIAAKEELGKIETRAFGWLCGCETPVRLLGALTPAYKANPSGMFGDADCVEVRCPRCAARHSVTRAMMEEHLESERRRNADKAPPRT